MSKRTIQVIARVTAQASNRNDPSMFVFIEQWSDEQAITDHFQQPYMQAAFSKALPLLAEPPQIEQYELLG